ncbi:uncharacterized protein LOC143179944 [Calliopsis andreniformis]|uniref:uncharacterized protein LOC143179944 n=1 Tax=Calliopsis andreniformis TaxID=337506 RepID=UPI003FCD0D00
MYRTMFVVLKEVHLQCRKKATMNLVRSSLSITKKQSCNCQQVYSTSRRCIHDTWRVLSSEKNDTVKNEIEDSPSVEDLTEPTNCCMSGCANCVWIQYAEKLSAALEKSDVDMQKVILEKVQDPNMRAFLSMELRFRNIIK